MCLLEGKCLEKEAYRGLEGFSGGAPFLLCFLANAKLMRRCYNRPGCS